MNKDSDLAASLEAQLQDLRTLRRAIIQSAEDQTRQIDAKLNDIEGALEGIYARRQARVRPEPVAEPTSRMTIKEMAEEVLSLLPEGATAQVILRRIRERYSAKIERESLSPQLSRLKAENRIELRGKTWFLRQKAEAPERRQLPLVTLDFDVFEGGDDVPRH